MSFLRRAAGFVDGFLTVYSVKIACLTNQQNRVFAVKFIHRKISHNYGLSDDDIGKEFMLHRACSGHPNIIKLLNFNATNSWLYLMMELATGGDLFDKIEPDVGVDEGIAHFYFKQLISAVEFIHTKGVAHRDIKPENILLDSKGNLKLADFGLATVYKKNNGVKRKCFTPCGSPPYMSPEIVDSNGYNPEMSDIWACGVVLFVLLTGETPWDEPTLKSPEFKTFVEMDGKILIKPWGKLSPMVLSLLRTMIRIDVDKRATIAIISKHPWVNKEDSYSNADGLCKDSALLTARLLESLHINLDDEDLAADENSQDELDQDSLRGQFMASQPVGDIAAMVNDDEDDVFSNYKFNNDNMPSTQQVYTEHSRAREFGDFGRDKILEIISKDPASVQFSSNRSANVSFNKFSSQRLTRFFSILPLESILVILNSSLSRCGVLTSSSSEDYELYRDAYLDEHKVQISIQAIDRRKNFLRGTIKISKLDNLKLKSIEFVKSKGDPLEWRRLFKRIVVLSREAVFVE